MAGLIKYLKGEKLDDSVPLVRKRKGRPIPPEKVSSTFMHAIELHYATFAQELLGHLLIPFWETNRTGLVESKSDSDICSVLREYVDKTGDKVSAAQIRTIPQFMRQKSSWRSVTSLLFVWCW